MKASSWVSDRSAWRTPSVRPAPAHAGRLDVPSGRRGHICRVRGVVRRRVVSRAALARADLSPPFEERQMEERKHLLSSSRPRCRSAAAAASLIYSHLRVISQPFFSQSIVPYTHNTDPSFFFNYYYQKCKTPQQQPHSTHEGFFFHE